MNSVDRLHVSIAAVCPIVGVRVPTLGSSVGVVIDFDPSATAPQIAAAQAALLAFDWSSGQQSAWQTSQYRAIAKSNFSSSTEPQQKFLRCMLEQLRAELNSLGLVVGSQTFVFDPANMANGAGVTSAGVIVSGAAFGDFVHVAAPYTLAGIVCTGYVSAANTVNVRLHNSTGGAVNLASGTWRVVVRRHPGARAFTQARTAIEALIDGGTLD